MQAKFLATGSLVTLSILLGLGVFFGASFRAVSVQGASMEPKHPHGTRFLATSAYWLVGAIHRGDVVVISDPKDPSQTLVKRVSALEKEEVSAENSPNGLTYRVPAHSIYVLGDNRDVSVDSREFGPVPLDSVTGKCVHLWSESMQVPFLMAFGGLVLIVGNWAVLRRLSRVSSRG